MVFEDGEKSVELCMVCKCGYEIKEKFDFYLLDNFREELNEMLCPICGGYEMSSCSLTIILEEVEKS